MFYNLKVCYFFQIVGVVNQIIAQVAAKLQVIIINQQIDKLETSITSMLSCINIGKSILSENNFSVIVNEIFDIINTSLLHMEKQNILNCISNHNVNSQEIYNWLLNNQNDSNSVMVLGVFNIFGIGINVNEQK